VLGQNSNPDIYWLCSPPRIGMACDWAALLRAPKVRRILVQREMRPELVIIRNVSLQNTTQLYFVEHDQVIKTFAPNRSDEPLDVAVLPYMDPARLQEPLLFFEIPVVAIYSASLNGRMFCSYRPSHDVSRAPVWRVVNSGGESAIRHTHIWTAPERKTVCEVR
jgi:hypothetical protein